MFDTCGCRDYGWSNWQTCDRGWITTVESLIAGCLIGTITNGNFTVTKGDRKRLQITRTIIEVTITGYLPKGHPQFAWLWQLNFSCSFRHCFVWVLGIQSQLWGSSSINLSKIISHRKLFVYYKKWQEIFRLVGGWRRIWTFSAVPTVQVDKRKETVVKTSWSVQHGRDGIPNNVIAERESVSRILEHKKQQRVLTNQVIPI